jgi:NADPH:quinone reductase-like Zn-dependent oxidoreductase
MAKIVRFHTIGSAEVLKLEDLPLNAPGSGEVRLKVEAIGLNRAEVGFREGQYLYAPELPSRLGYEAAGTVDAVGEGVSNIHIGDRVSTVPAFSMRQYGVYGESAIVPAHAVAAYPDHLSPSEGTSIWMQYLTVYGVLIEYGRIQSGDHVLITAASSSVGYAAIQMVKANGAVAIATTRGTAKKQLLLDAGADHVIVTNDEDLTKRVMEITAGKGADLIFDPVAGPLLETLAESAAQGATIFVYGTFAAAAPTPFPLMAALNKGLSVRGYTVFEITRDPEKLERGKRYIYESLQARTLKPVIDRTFKLDEIVEAHRYMESNQQNGKIVVTV